MTKTHTQEDVDKAYKWAIRGWIRMNVIEIKKLPAPKRACAFDTLTRYFLKTDAERKMAFQFLQNKED